jgi:hypothetical protein
MARTSSDPLRQLGIESVRNRNENEAVISDGKITAHTVMITPETVAQLEAVTALSEEQVGKLGA